MFGLHTLPLLELYFKFTSLNFNLYQNSAEWPESLTNIFSDNTLMLEIVFSALFQVNYAAFMNSDHHEVLYYLCMLIPVFPPVGWIMFSGLVSKTHPTKFNNYPRGANGQSKRFFPNSQSKRESGKRKQEKNFQAVEWEKRPRFAPLILCLIGIFFGLFSH